MRGGNTNLELWQHCFRMGMSTVCRLCPSPNSWRECYPCRKRGSGGYAGSTNPRAGCGPEARAPRLAGRWAVICTPKRATDTRAGCGPAARALRPAGRWAVICTPRRAIDTRAARGLAARALRPAGRWAVICTPRRSTNPRAGCGPEARAPSAGRSWSLLGPPTTACHQSSGRMRAGGPRSQRQRVLVGARPTNDGLPPILGQDAGRRTLGGDMYTKAFHRYSGRMRAGGPRSQTVEGTLCRIGKTMR